MCVYGIGTFGCEYKFSPISDWGRVCKISQIVYRVDYRTHVKFSKFSIWVPHDNPPSKQFAKIYIRTRRFESRTHMQNREIVLPGGQQYAKIQEKNFLIYEPQGVYVYFR
jgi:hypothetical protein